MLERTSSCVCSLAVSVVCNALHYSEKLLLLACPIYLFCFATPDSWNTTLWSVPAVTDLAF